MIGGSSLNKTSLCVNRRTASKIDDLPELLGPTRKVNGAKGILFAFLNPRKFSRDTPL
jgi:hypothetical protein